MVDLVNRICIVRDAEKRVPLLSDLESLTERHFEHEEAVLRQLYSAAPRDRRMIRELVSIALVEHSADHRRRLGDIRTISGALASGPLAAEAALCDELRGWFVDHAIGSEAQLKTVLQSV